MAKLIDLCNKLQVEIPEYMSGLKYTSYRVMTCKANYTNKNDVYFARYPSSEERLCKEAYQKGALALITRKPYFDEQGNPLPCIVVKNPLRCYIELCREIRESYTGKIIAVTGSLGKTTTKDMLNLVLNKKYRVSSSILNRNGLNSVGTGIQRLTNDMEYFVQEVGAASPKLIEKDAEMLQPNAVVITNISYLHLDKYKTIDDILHDKMALARRMPSDGVLFLNADDEKLMAVSDSHKKITFGLNNPKADYRVRNIFSKDGCLHFEILCGDEVIPVMLHSLGVHNVMNAVAAFAVARWVGMSNNEIISGLLDYYGYGIRQNYTNVGGYNLYIDCYSNEPDSLVGAVKVAEKIPVQNGKRRIAVVGDMRHLAERNVMEHHIEAGQVLGRSKFDLVLCFGRYGDVMAESIRRLEKKAYHTLSRMELNEWIQRYASQGDMLLFKAPVTQFMARTIDQVFGTTYHFYGGGRRKRETLENYDIIFVNEHVELELEEDVATVAVTGYRGKEKKLEIPAYFKGKSTNAILQKAFAGKLVREIVIADSVYNIGEQAFENCRSLISVKFPKDLKLIEKRAFYGCKKLRTAVLPEGTTDIYEEAFAECKALREVYLPKSIVRVDENVFLNSKSVILKTENPIVIEYAKKNHIAFE